MSESTDAPIDDLSPPTEAEPLEEPQLPARWPTVIGWISIVLGALSLCGNGLGVLQNFVLAPWMASLAANSGVSQPPPIQLGMAAVILMILKTAWPIPLIIAGIATVARAPAGRIVHLIHAFGFSITALIAAFVMRQGAIDYFNSQEMLNWAAENPGNPALIGFKIGTSIWALAIGLAISLAWPIFCLIWFLPSARSEKALRQDDEDALV